MYSQLKWNSWPSHTACSCMVSLVEIWLHEKWGLAPWQQVSPPESLHLPEKRSPRPEPRRKRSHFLVLSQNRIPRGWQHVQQPEHCQRQVGHFWECCLGWLRVPKWHPLASTGGVGFTQWCQSSLYSAGTSLGGKLSWLSWSVFQPDRKVAVERVQLWPLRLRCLFVWRDSCARDGDHTPSDVMYCQL